jgi:type VI secretion system Hcp family effector
MTPVRSFLLGLCFSLCALTSSAQGPIYMQVTGSGAPQGEVTQTGFIGWTEINDFNAGATLEVSLVGGGGGGAGIPATKCFTISMLQDKASYYLKRQLYTGIPLTRVELVFQQTNGGGTLSTYYKVLMENVYVTAIEEAGNQDGRSLMNVSFTPSRFKYTYTPLSAGGNPGTPVVFGWDVAQNVQW